MVCQIIYRNIAFLLKTPTSTILKMLLYHTDRPLIPYSRYYEVQKSKVSMANIQRDLPLKEVEEEQNALKANVICLDPQETSNKFYCSSSTKKYCNAFVSTAV